MKSEGPALMPWLPRVPVNDNDLGTFFGVDRSRPALRLEGFFPYPRCHVPHAGRCPESLLDAWDLYDTGPPDTACLCEGGACVSSPTTASRPRAAPGR